MLERHHRRDSEETTRRTTRIHDETEKTRENVRRNPNDFRFLELVARKNEVDKIVMIVLLLVQIQISKNPIFPDHAMASTTLGGDSTLGAVEVGGVGPVATSLVL